jgi:hypothetical protein
MAYIAPTTRATGYTITAAADWNPLVNDIISLRPDVCLVGRTAVLSVANNTDTPVPWDYERLDVQNMHNPADNTKITVLRAGVYRVTVNLEFAAHAGGYDDVWFKLNGAGGASIGRTNRIGDASRMNAFSLSAEFTALAGALPYVEVYVKQTSGGPINLSYDGVYFPMFSVSMVQDNT